MTIASAAARAAPWAVGGAVPQATAARLSQGAGRAVQAAVAGAAPGPAVPASMVRLEALQKFVDASQLPQELEGTFPYDHAQWVDLRVALEEFIWRATDLLDRLEDLRDELGVGRTDFPDDVASAKHRIELHNEMKKRILQSRRRRRWEPSASKRCLLCCVMASGSLVLTLGTI